MEAIRSALTTFGAMSEAAVTSIIVAAIGVGGTAITYGYKYIKDKPKPEDQSTVLFNQVNEFIKQQKEDRDDLRAEVEQLRNELEQVRQENRLKSEKIDELTRENRELRAEIEDVREAARQVAEKKIEEDNTHG